MTHWSFVVVAETKSYTREEALRRAEEYGLVEEITYLIEHGHSPTDALAEWDIL